MSSARLFVTCGDPNGIGPEITLRAIVQLPEELRQRLLLASAFPALQQVNERMGEPLRLMRVESLKQIPASDTLPVLDLTSARGFTLAYGKVSAAAGWIAGKCIMVGVQACQEQIAAALVTAPACKEALHLAGFHYPGQTEMLAGLCGAPRTIMILAGERLRVGLATTHAALREVPELLRRDLVRDKIITLSDALRRWFGIERPRLAVAALNPHASDGGLYGNEEATVIKPAIAEAAALGVLADGPLPADTLFARWTEYDAVLAMYHDQGMIPIKVAAFGQAINFTGGLPFPRTSPDHGVAFDIAGKMIADPSSMRLAVEKAAQFADIKDSHDRK